MNHLPIICRFLLILLFTKESLHILFKNHRSLIEVEPDSSLSSRMIEMNRLVPVSPIKFEDITKIVQNIAKANDLTIEFEESGKNTIDYHMSQKFGRSLNLMVNKYDDEIMHFTLSSSDNNLINESQISAFGASEKDISELISSSIQQAKDNPKDRKLNSVDSLTINNIENEIIKKTSQANRWNFKLDESQKCIFASLKSPPSSRKIKITIVSDDKIGAISFDDREKINEDLIDHMFVGIKYSKNELQEKLITIIDEKLKLFEKKHSESVKNKTKISQIVTFLSDYFKEYDCKVVSTKNGQILIQIFLKGSSSDIVGSIEISRIEKVFIAIRIVIFNDIVTIFTKNIDFESQKEHILKELNTNLKINPKNHVGLKQLTSLFAAKMNQLCGTSANIEFTSYSSTTYAFLSKDKQDSTFCVFMKSDIFLTEFNFELFSQHKFVQVSISNNMIQNELIFKVNSDNLEMAVSQFVMDLFADLNDAQTFFDSKEKEDKVDFETVKELIKQSKFVAKNDLNYEFSNKNGSVIIILKNLEEYIGIHIFIKKATILKNQSYDTSKEIFVSKESDKNEKKRIKSLIDSAIADLDK